MGLGIYAIGKWNFMSSTRKIFPCLSQTFVTDLAENTLSIIAACSVHAE
jgi:hypothetical protein